MFTKNESWALFLAGLFMLVAFDAAVLSSYSKGVMVMLITIFIAGFVLFFGIIIFRVLPRLNAAAKAVERSEAQAELGDEPLTDVDDDGIEEEVR